jgi:diaminobutyrate-2-oxoglutarate transaminase
MTGTDQGRQVVTAVPGPLSKEYLDRQETEESSARTYPRRLPFAVRRAQGSRLEDVDGNVYLDFLSGAGALTLGHNHPHLVAAVRGQLDELVHGLDLPTPIKAEFTRRQLDRLPESLRDRMKLHFCGPTGANGVEAAIKLAKIHTGRADIISFQGAFHGSTTGALAVTGSVDVKQVVPNLMPGVHFFPYSYCRRCPVGLSPDSCSTNCATYLERALTDSHSGIPKPAAVIIELVQGEGGTIPARREFVHRVRELTRQHDVLLIVDEVQTGCGRTGTWFAFEQYGIEPDIIVASKGLSGIGLPVAILLYDRHLDSWQPGAHIGTFRGNQLAFASGVAALDVIDREAVLSNVVTQGRLLGELLAGLSRRSPWIAEVRGVGLMWGVELVDPRTGRSATELAAAVQAAALRNGLILEVGGRDDCVLRMLPPLNVDAATVQQAMAALEDAFAEADPEFDLEIDTAEEPRSEGKTE